MKKLLVLMLAMLAWSCTDDTEEPFVRPPVDSEEPWILVDLYHTTKQNPADYQLKKGEFNYQGVFGFWRAFKHVEDNGYKWTSLRTEPLSAARLEGFDVLFINLLHSEKPDFTDDEVQVIIDYVKNGGGLFVIADHTNVYFHAERINRFLIPMGIEVTYHTATDQPPTHSVAGLGWTLTWDFAEHPVTAGLEMISLQTGGPMISESGGLAFTSEASFADYWDKDAGGGLFGNWTWDGIKTKHTLTVNGEDQTVTVTIDGVEISHIGTMGDTDAAIASSIAAKINETEALREIASASASANKVTIVAAKEWTEIEVAITEGMASVEETLPYEALERKGPLEVLAAETFGEGRVVVAGDQNMFGDAWLHFGDNFELFMNTIEWTAKREGAETPLRTIRPFGTNISLHQRNTDYKAGRSSNEGFFHYFVNANRDLNVTTRATLSFDGKDDVMMIMSPTVDFSAQQLTDMKKYLRDGKRLVLTFSADQITPTTIQAISELAPDFDINGVEVTDEGFATLMLDKVPAPLQAVSSRIVVDDLSIGDWDGAGNAADLLDVVSAWGEPLLQTTGDGKTLDIARYKKTAEGGELILWMQDGLFRGRSMGEYLTRPADWNSPQIELHYRFNDFLRTPVAE